jgi:phospholipase/carboxylesterase
MASSPHTRGQAVALFLGLLALAACRSKSAGPVAESAAESLPGASEPLSYVVVGMPQSARGGRLVLLLHGWGAAGDDLVPLAERLARQPQTRFIVPAAPLPHPAGGRAWWPLDLDRIDRLASAGGEAELSAEVPPGLSFARAKVLALLAEVRQRYQPRTIVVAGFSQGGMLAMDVGLHTDPPVDGVAVLSGALIAAPVWKDAMARVKPRPRVFVSHGRGDRTLPFTMSVRLKELLEPRGFAVTWLPFAGGHEIPDEVIDALADFIGR